MINYPPRFPEDEIITTMTEGLQEIIPVKLKEIMDRQDELVRVRDIKLKYLYSRKLPEFDMYFNSLIVELDFVEYDILRKWLKYWLRLAKKTSDNHVWEKVSADINPKDLPEERVEEARETPLEDLYEGKLRKTGERFVGVCPFHKEKTPSFHIFTHDNSFYCFGCHERGDAIDFYMRLHDVSFVKAVKALT